MQLNSAGYAVMRQHWPHCGSSLIDTVIMMHLLSERPGLSRHVWVEIYPSVTRALGCQVGAEPVTLRANSTDKALLVSLGTLSTCAVPYAAIKTVMITRLKNDTQKGSDIGTSAPGVVKTTRDREPPQTLRSFSECAHVYERICVFVLFLSCNWMNRPQRSQWLVN